MLNRRLFLRKAITATTTIAVLGPAVAPTIRKVKTRLRTSRTRYPSPGPLPGPWTGPMISTMEIDRELKVFIAKASVVREHGYVMDRIFDAHALPHKSGVMWEEPSIEG